MVQLENCSKNSKSSDKWIVEFGHSIHFSPSNNNIITHKNRRVCQGV